MSRPLGLLQATGRNCRSRFQYSLKQTVDVTYGGEIFFCNPSRITAEKRDFTGAKSSTGRLGLALDQGASTVARARSAVETSGGGVPLPTRRRGEPDAPDANPPPSSDQH
jgi:hypothetical protein